MKKVSIIVPVYRAEKVLRRCLDSILNQTYKNIELILIDDGSPDISGKICDDYADKDSRVVVIHKKNAGVAAARNSGLDIATGEYCTFVDSDDYIEPFMYEHMMKIAMQYDCEVVMCDCVKEYGNKTEVYTHNIRPGYYDRWQIETEYFPHLLMMPNVEYPPTISNWVCLYKRVEQALCSDDSVEQVLTKLSKLRYEEGIRFSEDLLFGAELMYNANSFYYMKEKCYYHYWMNPQSATHTFAVDKWNDYIKLHKKICEIFLQCKKYDFSHQIDLVLLFFVYNSVSDIIYTSEFSRKEKVQKCKEILQSSNVRKMFSRLNIKELPVTRNLKILTLMYKYNIGIKILIKKVG